MTLKNTKNTYIIDVRNVQTIDKATDVITERANGQYYERGDKKYILYKSSDEGAEYSSSVIVSSGAVTIKRSGGVKSNMSLELGKRTSCVYHTPYGKINMEIETERIVSDLSHNGGTLRLKYTLIMQDEKYYNDMTIRVIGDAL